MSVIDDGALTWNYQGYWGTNAGYGPAWLELLQNLNQRCDFMGVTRPTVALMQPDPEVDPVSPVGLCSSGQTPVNVRDMLSAMQTKLNTLEAVAGWRDSDGTAYSGFDLTTLSMTRPNLKAICENIRQSLNAHRYKYVADYDPIGPWPITGGSYNLWAVSCRTNGTQTYSSWVDSWNNGVNLVSTYWQWANCWGGGGPWVLHYKLLRWPVGVVFAFQTKTMAPGTSGTYTMRVSVYSRHFEPYWLSATSSVFINGVQISVRELFSSNGDAHWDIPISGIAEIKPDGFSYFCGACEIVIDGNPWDDDYIIDHAVEFDNYIMDIYLNPLGGNVNSP